jgi:hypothetical protein
LIQQQTVEGGEVSEDIPNSNDMIVCDTNVAMRFDEEKEEKEESDRRTLDCGILQCCILASIS